MKIIELQLLSNDLVSTEAFYHGILDLNIRKKTSTEISFIVGSSILQFNLSKVLKPVYHFAFNIPKNKLEEAYVWISNKVNTIAIEGDNYIADFSSWNARAFYFYDNNGNILEFIARYDLDNAIDKAFDSSSIQSISEIGVVVEDVLAETDKLITKYNLELFSNSSLPGQFAAIGDNEGLFIVVKEGRDWYPTNFRAEAFWFKLGFEVNEGMFDYN